MADPLKSEIEEEKLNLSDIKPLDVWTIIETYFRDNPNYKTQHQVDSFNEFLTSETNGIKFIIKRENPLIIYKEALDANKNDYKYQINIYYGETLNEDGSINETIKENIYFSSPIEYIADSGKQTYMYPNIARLKGYTYASCIFCNIGIEFIDNVKETKTIKNFQRLNIGLLPIMIKSKNCILNGLDDTELTELGECPYDPGGYFIIKGKEKVFLSQEKKINDILYINSINDETLPIQCVLKTVSTEGFQSSRTNTIMMNRVTLEYDPSNKDLSTTDKRYCHRVTVRILGITDFNIPVFILFRALGFTTDKDIIEAIIYDSDTELLRRNLIELLVPSVKDSHPICDQKSAYKLLSMYTKGKEVINVIDILKNNFLPKYQSNREKCLFLGFSIRKLFLTHLKVLPETERDSYALKRIDLAGSLLLELYRELWGKFKRETSLRIDKEHKFHFKEYDEDITNIVNENNIKKIFNASSMDTIVKSFGAVFGTNLSARQGIVQDLNRNTMLGTLSHLIIFSNEKVSPT